MGVEKRWIWGGLLRLTLVGVRLVRIASSFTLVWFILLALNFAGPFTVNLLGEIMMISRLVSQVVIFSIPISLVCFAAVIYRLVLYASTQQGAEAGMAKSCALKIRSRELLVRTMHI